MGSASADCLVISYLQRCNCRKKKTRTTQSESESESFQFFFYFFRSASERWGIEISLSNHYFWSATGDLIWVKLGVTESTHSSHTQYSTEWYVGAKGVSE